MNIEEFKIQYKSFKDADKIQITCDHPNHTPYGEIITIGKQPAKRNILKNGGKKFLCRACYMKFNNPNDHVGPSRQTDEEITVFCPSREHEGEPSRQMKKSCYYGGVKEPYLQVCRSCSQRGHEVSEETRAALSEALKGIPKSEEFKKNLSAYWAAHPERREEATAILLANRCTTGMLGKHLSDETKQKQSDAMTGREYTEDHCEHISEGRKKMLEETGGFTREHRENISKATLRQYAAGFDPKLHHLKGIHESPKAGKVRYRSSYEKKAYLKLDADETVKTYRPEVVTVKYLHPKKGITSSYIIDLEVEYTDGTKRLIEIKPAKWLTNVVVKAKIEAGMVEAQRLGIDFEIWTELSLFGHVYNDKRIRDFANKVKSGEL